MVDERVTSHTTCHCLIVCTIVCAAYPFNTVHKSGKQSKLCLSGSHYLSSFRELSKSIWIVFLFQNFREPATVASFENYPFRTAQVQSPLPEVRAPSWQLMKIYKCFLYCVCWVLTNFDFSRGYQNNIKKKNIALLNNVSFKKWSVLRLLALYRQVFLVLYMM